MRTAKAQISLCIASLPSDQGFPCPLTESLDIKQNHWLKRFCWQIWTWTIRIYSKKHTKKCLYNFDPLKPHFYIVKLGFTGVYISFLISSQNMDGEYSLQPPRRGGSNEYPQYMFWAENMENIIFFLSEIFHFLVVKFLVYLNRHVFVMKHLFSRRGKTFYNIVLTQASKIHVVNDITMFSRIFVAQNIYPLYYRQKTNQN